MKIFKHSCLFPFFSLIAISFEIYIDPLAKNNGDGSFSRPFNNISEVLTMVLKDKRYFTYSIFIIGRVELSLTQEYIEIGGEDKKAEILVKGIGEASSPAITMEFPRVKLSYESSFKIVNLQIKPTTNIKDVSEASCFYLFYVVRNASLNLEEITFSHQVITSDEVTPLILSSFNGTITMNNVIFYGLPLIASNNLILIQQSYFIVKNVSIFNISIESKSLLFILNAVVLISNLTFKGNELNFKGLDKITALLHLSDCLATIEVITFQLNKVLASQGNLAFFENMNSLVIKKINISFNFMGHGIAIKFVNITESLILIDSALIYNYEIAGITLYNVTNYYLENIFCFGNNMDSCESAYGCVCLSISKCNQGKLVESVFRENCASWTPSGVFIIQTKVPNSLMMISITFEENTSAYKNEANFSSVFKGNAIYVRNSLNLSIFYSLFKRNFIKTDSASITYGSGPGLYFENDVTIAALFCTVFIENGAVSRSNCIDANSIMLLTLDNCTFIRNKAHADKMNQSIASAIYCGAVEILVIQNVVVQENTAFLEGILTFYSKGPTSFHKVVIKKSLFIFNTGLYHGVLFFGFEECNLLIEESVFFKNTADKGAVVGGGFISRTFLALFDNCQFISNEARYEGGVGHIANIGGNYKFLNCYFFKNSAQKGGVFIYVATIDSPIIIESCIFSNNHASRRGGISAISSGTIYDFSSVYINNSAKREGGVHILENNALVQINCSVLLKSNSDYVGGIAVLMEENSLIIKGGSLVIGSRAKVGACLVANTMSKLKVVNVTFLLNEAEWGTLIYLANCIYVNELSEIYAIWNKATRGALFQVDSSKLKATGIKFFKNKAGAIAFTNSDGQILNVESNDDDCDNIKKIKACLLFLGENSQLNFTFFTIRNLTTPIGVMFIKNEKSMMLLSQGEILLTGSDINTNIIYAEFSNSTIQALLFQGLGNVAVLCKKGVLILDSIIIDKPNDQLGTALLKCLYCKDFQLINSRISKSNTSYPMGTVSILGETILREPTLFLINNSVFNDNYGANVGVIYIENARVKLTKCSFSRNTANQKGGAIHLNNAFLKVAEVIYESIINNCSFFENSASLSGAAVYWEGKEPLDLITNTFSGNKAPHGSNIASDPAYLLPSAESPTIIASGETVEKPLIFLLVDVYKQIIKHVQNITATIFWSERAAIEEIKGVLDEQTAEILEGQFIFYSISLISTPGKENTFFIKTSAIEKNYKGDFLSSSINDKASVAYPLPSENKFNEKEKFYYLSFVVKFRDCVVGEIFVPELNICKKCPSGQFSLSLDDNFCRNCPSQALCEGGSHMTILSGFWRVNSSSLNFYQCEKGCTGGMTENLCKDGYGGPLCASCIFDSAKRFFKINDFDCEKCESFSENSLFFVFIIKLLIVVCILLFFVITNIRAQAHAIQAVMLRRKTHIQLIKMRIERKQLNAFIKLLINYLQIFSMISNLKIKWPEYYTSLSSAFSIVINHSLLILPLDCLLMDLGLKIAYPLLMMKIILGLGLFYSMIIITMLYWVLHKIFLGKEGVKNEIMSSILIPIYIFQPAIVNLLMTPLKCRAIEGRKYISAYVDVSCEDGFYYNRILPILAPNLVIWMVLAPAALLIYIKYNKLVIYTTAKYYTCDFIINGYNHKMYYWEFIHLLNKYFVILITSFVPENNIAALLLFFILNLFLLIEISYKPYQKDNLNTLSILSQTANLINIIAGIFFGTDININAHLIIFVSAVIFNTAFLLLWMKNFFSVAIVRTLNFFRNIISRICPHSFIRINTETKSKTQIHPSLKLNHIKISKFNPMQRLAFENPS